MRGNVVRAPSALKTLATRLQVKNLLGEFSVSLLVWLIALVTLLPSTIVAFYALEGWSTREAQRDRALVASLTQGLGQALDRHLSALTDTVEVLAGSRHLLSGDLKVFGELAREAASQSKGHFVLIDRSMRQLVNTRVATDAALPLTGNPTDVKRVFETGKTVITDLRQSAVVQTQVIAINIPVSVDGEVKYVLGHVPATDTILNIIGTTYRPEGWLAAVVDGSGIVLARSQQHEMFYGKRSNYFSQFSGESGIIESVDLERRPSITAYQKLGMSNWRAVVWVPKSILEAPRRGLLTLLFSFALATLLISALGAWGVSHLIRRPTSQLVSSARNLGHGKPITFKPTIMREANIVNEAMAAASREIVERTSANQTIERRLRLAIEASESGFWSWDTETGERTFDDRTRDIAGWTASTAIDGAGILAQIHPADRDMVIAALHKARDPGSSRIVKAEFRIRTLAGEQRWLRSQAHAHINDRGNLQMVGVVRDISERKRAETKIELLMQEVIHRSNNMLTVVQAIARQTVKTGEPKTFLARFGERLNALAASQRLLAESRWSGVQMADLLNAQLAHYKDFIGSRIRMTGPPILLLPDAAQAIGMAMHELATNATKYGALSNADGRIEIVWDVRRNGHEPEFHIRWAEHDGPKPVTPPNSNGFGKVVVGRMIEAAVNGKVDMEFRDTGLVWQLSSPAANTLESNSRKPNGPYAVGI
jgi:PAS domain S-box-containing protein